MVATGTDISIVLTTIFMKISGLWMAANCSEQRVRNITLLYTIALLFFAIGVQTTDFYYSHTDLSVCLYLTCNISSLIMSLSKMIILFLHRKDFFKLIVYMQKKFLIPYNDCTEKAIVDSTSRVCTVLILSFTLFAQITVMTYILGPALANIGRNSSDRMLPFNMYLGVSWSVSPYFEMMFILQALAVYQVGVCYFCFDNLLCVMNLHVAGQFRILQYRLENLMIGRGKENLDTSVESVNKRYNVFKQCVRQHQALIAYCDTLERVFSTLGLGQVLMFSLIICLDGYQVFMAEGKLSTRLIFVFHSATCMSQLLMFTYSCDCLIQESSGVAQATYAAPWCFLPMSKYGRMLRNDLILVIMRSRVPCCLTARGFFVISLETYTRVLSTAVSYFTLLRQGTENIVASTEIE